MKLAFINAALLYLFSTMTYAELIFYPLQHKTPESIIPTIQPFLQPDETIGAARNELILRINKGNIVELKRLINKLDTPNHRLVIYVNRDGNFKQHTKGYNVNQTLRLNNHSSGQHRYEGKLKIHSTSKRSADNNNQSIQVLDGHTAHISSGVSEPISNIQIIHYGQLQHISSDTKYREASKGFYVTPRLQHESVVLEIAPWAQQSLADNPTPSFLRASSVIRGKLNTWIELSGTNEHASSASTGLFSKHQQTTKKEQKIWLKVVDLDAAQ